MKQEYDVIVAGAGLAGVCAAVAAARAGARTAVVERQPFAGGISTASMEPSICNFFHNTKQERIVGGCPLELVERMVQRGAVSGNWSRHRGHIVFDVELGKLVMDEMLEEAGVDILFGALVVGTIAEGEVLRGLRLASCSGLETMFARCTVDATGDADVAAYAGAALNVGPGHAVPHSFLFRLGNVDVDELVRFLKDNPSEYVGGSDIDLSFEEAMRFYDDTGTFLFHHHAAERMATVQEAIKRGEYSKEWGPFRIMDAFQMHAIRHNRTMVINTGYFDMPEPDAATVSYFLRHGRKLAHYVGAFLKKHLPGLSDSFVVSTANFPGLRRTRWLEADFTLTRQLYEAAPQYDDRIGRGVVVKQHPLYVTDKTFDIPRRCLLPQGIENLIIGSGRSASCVPAELLRTMPVTMIVGQGAGVVAAIAAGQGVGPGQADMGRVQEELKRQGVNIE